MTALYSRGALVQINDILEYLEAESRPVATAFSRRLETLADLLDRRPTMGRSTDLAGVRVFALRPYPYLLFYREGRSGITVLRVRHMARDEDWRAGR